MKKMIACLMALLGLNSACCQQHFENTDADGFARLTTDKDVVILDVRTLGEFEEGHIPDAVNIDVGQPGFIEKVKATLSAAGTIAVYCRSGRRSADAAEKLAAEGFKVVNLKGGIIEWKESGKPVTTDSPETDIFTTQNGNVIRLYSLIHSSIRIVYDGREIEIDPVGKMGNRTTDYIAMPKADYILITHEHGDHLDKDAIQALMDADTRLITNKRCAEMLGFGETMENGDTKQLADDITLEAVPAYNTSEGHLQFHPQGRDNGFVLTLDGTRIYIAGDTEDIPEMSALKDIDIAFLPCNQPYTMTEEQLLNAARTFRPKVLFPYHYGQTDISNIPLKLADDGIETRIRHFD